MFVSRDVALPPLATVVAAAALLLFAGLQVTLADDIKSNETATLAMQQNLEMDLNTTLPANLTSELITEQTSEQTTESTSTDAPELASKSASESTSIVALNLVELGSTLPPKSDLLSASLSTLSQSTSSSGVSAHNSTWHAGSMGSNLTSKVASKTTPGPKSTSTSSSSTLLIFVSVVALVALVGIILCCCLCK